MSLRNQIFSGAIWTYSQQFSTQIIQFVVSIVLARLISPEDFGLIGMITIFISIGNALFEGGLTNSLIRSNKLDDNDYSTVFIFNVIISCLIYLIIFTLAPYISRFYNQDILKILIRVYSISFVINSFSAVQNTILVKKMEFKKIAFLGLPAITLNGIVAISMAINGFGVWSLVFSFLASSLCSTILLWIFVKWKPSLVFSKTKFLKHFGYGNKLMISSILDIIFSNAYQIVIGKIYNAGLLGYYTRANTLMMLPVTNISTTLNKVAFPAFSQIQDDEDRLKAAYKKIMLLVLYVTTPFLTLMLVLAKPLIIFLITEKWIEIVPIFQVLCIAGILYPLHVYNLLILQVKGKSNLFLYLELSKKILTVIILVISIKFGFFGLLWGQVVFSIICLFINTHYAGRFLNYNLFQQLKDMLPIFLLSVLLGGIVYYINNNFLIDLPNYIKLIVGSIIGVSFYIGFSIIFNISSFSEIKKIIVKK